ncbi:branched-subunit amino acid transport system permease [Roseateles toxinivorans]|uniref:Branched-subunit amino acid transport system permease n=1 Tax=Roseateles toxinivorans TaxID=270368 RepID=A0A4R6QRQ9_9BURK|nr:branched-subunit amino acid transport system permease [Roseateles toxinivorans]
MPKNKGLPYPLAAIALLVAPLLLQQLGNGPVRIVNQALLYVLLALGMNIVVGYAGLLDLGYVAFYALGAYVLALLCSPHLSEKFAGVHALFPAGLHTPWWLVIPLGAGLAGLLGVLLGAPPLKLHGDYLAGVIMGALLLSALPEVLR